MVVKNGNIFSGFDIMCLCDRWMEVMGRICSAYVCNASCCKNKTC